MKRNILPSELNHVFYYYDLIHCGGGIIIKPILRHFLLTMSNGNHCFVSVAWEIVRARARETCRVFSDGMLAPTR